MSNESSVTRLCEDSKPFTETLQTSLYPLLPQTEENSRKIFKTLVVGQDVGYCVVPQILVGVKRKQASESISHDTL